MFDSLLNTPFISGDLFTFTKAMSEQKLFFRQDYSQTYTQTRSGDYV